MMVVRSCMDERLLARSEAEGARRRGPRHPQEGGSEDLWRLDAHPGEVSKAKEGKRRVSPRKIPWPNAVYLRKRRGAAGSLEATRREQRGYLGASLRAVEDQAEGQGFHLHHEQDRAQVGMDL